MSIILVIALLENIDLLLLKFDTRLLASYYYYYGSYTLAAVLIEQIYWSGSG